MRSLKTCSILVTAGLLLGAAAHAQQTLEELQAPTKKWTNGPVQYLLSGSERKDFKKLKNDDDRQEFIDEFWRRRARLLYAFNGADVSDVRGLSDQQIAEALPDDADLDATARRLRAAFWDRVATLMDPEPEFVQRYFPTRAFLPWRTDWGRFLIRVGLPDVVDRPGTASIVYTYYALGARAGQSEAQLTFVDQSAGDYRLLSDSTSTEVERRFQEIIRLPNDAFLVRKGGTAVAARPAATPPPGATGGLQLPGSGVLDAAGGETLTQDELSEEELALQRVARGESSFDGPAFDTRLDYFKSTDTETYVAITVALDGSHAGAGPQAWMESTDDEPEMFPFLGEQAFGRLEGLADGRQLYQTGAAVTPGTYRVGVVHTAADGTQGSWQGEIEVPSLTDGEISLSSLVLAHSIETLDPTQVQRDVKAPFVLGNTKVVPRLGDGLVDDGTLRLYYQVYNVGDDASVNLDVKYTFFQKRGSRFTEAGADPYSGITQRALRYELPVDAWPSGDYKIQVDVVNNQNGDWTSDELEFQVGR